MVKHCIPLVALVAASCGWNDLPSNGTLTLEQGLWDPAGAVATNDALYVRLSHSGGLARITPGGGAEVVELGEGNVRRIASAPDGQTVVAFVERYQCDPDDPREARRVRTVADCASADLTVETEIALVTGTTADPGQPINGAYNAIAFSDDGRYAIAYVDFSRGIELQGVVNLTGIVLIDLVDNSSRLVTVGFAPDQVLFTYDEGGTTVSAVVLSRNQVANVRLGTDTPAVTRFPLTLDPDTLRDPTGVVLTPDGRFALISTANSPDLYAIDLVNESINIVDLSGTPSALAVDATADRTVLVYRNRSVVEVMEHQFFEVDLIDLDEGMDQITTYGGEALLWGSGNQHDVYRLDLRTNALVEYRIQNPAVSMHVTPTREFAIALTRPEGGAGNSLDAIYDRNPGMEIIDLTDNDSEPFILEGQGRGVAFSSDGVNLNALVLQTGVDYLYRYDLYARKASEIELPAPPIAIGSLGEDGPFWITHDRALGLVSFFDPGDGSLTEVSGFAGGGLVDPIDLIDASEESP